MLQSSGVYSKVSQQVWSGLVGPFIFGITHKKDDNTTHG